MTYAPPTLARWTITLLFLLMAVGVPALAAFASAAPLSKSPWLALIGLTAYEALVVCLGFIAFPNYRRRYLKYVCQEQRALGLRAVTRQGAAALDLERLYVPLYLDAEFINQSPASLLKMVPGYLRRGNHTLNEYFSAKELVGQNFVVVGEVGSGKTTLLKRLAFSLAAGKLDLPPAYRSHLPVLLFLREHAGTIRDNPYLPLPQAIGEHLARRQAPAPPVGWFEAQLEAGNCLVLLDGLNEITDPQMRLRVQAWVKGCLIAYPRNRFVISSRMREYRAMPLADLLVLEPRPFSRDQIDRLAQRWQAARLRDVRPTFARDFLAALEKTPGAMALASNPLRLTLLANLCMNGETLPVRRVELYAASFTLAPGNRRLPAAQRQRLLQWLAYHMQCNRQYDIPLSEALAVVAPLLVALEIKEPAEAFLRKVADTTGLLARTAPGQYSFAHAAFQEYLAAAYMVENQLQDELIAQAGDLWWHETFRFYCAQTEASAVVAAILGNEQPPAATVILALESLEDALEARPAVVAQCAAAIREALDGCDPEHRRWVAEALLAARLRRLARQGGGAAQTQPALDETLVTCAEYQLFLDEQRPEGQFFQPDHWPGYRFGAGQGQRPVTGVRSSDAIAFCAWLTEREPGEWVYRLPTTREVRDLVHPAETTTGLGYWTASSAGERGGRAHMVLDLAWVDAFRLPAVSEEDLRLAMEADLTLDLVQLNTADLARDRDCNLKLAEALAWGRDLDHDLGLARDPRHDLESAQALAHDLAATLGLDLGLDVGFEFELARDRERDLGYDLSLARAPDPGLDAESIRDLTRARRRVADCAPAHLRARLTALDLMQAQGRARALSSKLEHLSAPNCALALTLEKILAHNLSLALDRDLDRDLALALDSDRALANALALTLHRAHHLKLIRARERVGHLSQVPEHEANREMLGQIGGLAREDNRPDSNLLLDLVQARDLALPIDLDLTVTLELARAHARDRDRAVRLARTLANARDLVRDYGRSRNRAITRLIFLLNALLTQPEARGAGAVPEADSPAAVTEAERQRVSGLYFDLYLDFVTLEGRVRGTLQPFEGIRLVRARKKADGRS